jgi:fructokinase
MKKIFCVGEALIDMICTDKGRSLNNGEHFLKRAGGAPANVAAAIAALGGSVELCAKIGADPFGKNLKEVMQQLGVGTRWMLQSEEHFTTFAFVSLMENGERDFYFNRGADGQLTDHDLQGIHLNEFSIIHFGSATAFLAGPLQQTYKNLLQQALQQNLFISFDPNYRHLLFKGNTQSFIKQSWFFLERCHFFKLSDEEAILLTGNNTVMDAAQALARKTKAIFAITLGKEGTLFRHGNSLVTIPSIPITPVDTTGAGDAFVGAVLYQLQSKTMEQIQATTPEDWKNNIANANKAGARTCEFLGAMEAFKQLANQFFK